MRLPAGLDPARLRAAFLDLDGTLLSEGRPLPGATQALAALRASGITPVIATGRMLTTSLRVAAELGIEEGPLVCYQGAVVADVATGGVLHHHPLARNVARELVVAVQELGHTVNVFWEERVCVSSESEWSQFYSRFAGVPLHVVGDLADWLPGPVTKLVSVGEPEAMDALRDALVPRFADRAFIAKSLPHYLEFAAHGVSKATGAERAAAILGISAAEVVAFGDGENDLELLDWAGYGIAVAGGFPALIEGADAVAPPAEEAGVPRLIEAIAAGRAAL